MALFIAFAGHGTEVQQGLALPTCPIFIEPAIVVTRGIMELNSNPLYFQMVWLDRCLAQWKEGGMMFIS
jgi:hypothetical protein